MSRLALHLLGSFRATLDDEPLTAFESDKVRALLAYLAVEADRPHRREKLVGLLWPGWPERSARQNLSQALYNLRAAIGDREADPPFLRIEVQTLQFNRDSDCSLDADLLLKLPNNPTVEALEAAAAACDGDFLAGFSLPDSPEFEEWALVTREALRHRVLDVLAKLSDHHEATGNLEVAVVHTRRATGLDPTCEPAHRALMQLLALSDQRAAAMAQYESCRQTLWEALGVEPAAETVSLYERIRAGEMGAPVVAQVDAVPRPAFLADGAGPVPGPPVFVGRQRELAQLDAWLERAIGGRGQVAFVIGDPGRGKTALIEVFIRAAIEGRSDLLGAIGKCNAFAGLGDPYLPFRDILEMLTGEVESRWAIGAITMEHAARLWRALPEVTKALVENGPDLIDILVPGRPLLSRAVAHGPQARLQALVRRKRDAAGTLEQPQLFEEVTQVLCHLSQEHPLLLVLDDLQWADAASISLLFHLGQRIQGGRVMIVGAYRPEEVALGRDGERHPLESVLAEFKRRFGEVWIDLGATEAIEGRKFVDDLLDTEPNRLGAPFRKALLQHAGAHPLFTIEVLRALQERGDLIRDEEGRWVKGSALDWGTLPVRVEGVIEERIGRLEPEFRDILTVASVEGEDFTAQVVARVQEVGERQLLRKLSGELERRHRLVHEKEEVLIGERILSRYEFAHALFQQHLYHKLSAGERRLLHRDIAQVLEDLYGDKAAEQIAPQLARHFQAAGHPAKAIPYLIQVGDRASRMYAHREAIAAYQDALTLLKDICEWERAGRTAMKLGLTYHSAFDFDRAIQAHDEGFLLLRRAGQTRRAAPLPAASHPLRHWAYQPPTFDPTLCAEDRCNRVIVNLFSGLVAQGPELDIEPDVATSWRVSQDGLEYVFLLRDDVKWSDGTPVSAVDFEYAWKRTLHPATRSGNASLFFDIKGAEAFHRGAVGPEGVGVRALDPVTLVVQLGAPTAYFLHLMAHSGTFPVPRHVVEANGEEWATMDNFVCNGPFKLEAWRPGESLVLVKNPGFHGPFKGNVVRVEIDLSLPDWSTRLKTYEDDSSGFAILGGIPEEDEEMDYARRRHAGEYFSIPFMGTRYLVFNTTRAPFGDPRVRRAFAMATDRRAIANVITRGYTSPATGGLVPLTMPGHSPGIGLPYDPDLARLLLAEAGYPGGTGLPVIAGLTYGHLETLRDHLSEKWREILGVDTTWEEQTGPLPESAQTDVFLESWTADYPDPHNFLRDCLQYLSTLTGWRNDTYESLIERARWTANQASRIQFYRHADQILVEEAPIVPLYYMRLYYFVKPWLRNAYLRGVDYLYYADVIIEPH